MNKNYSNQYFREGYERVYGMYPKNVINQHNLTLMAKAGTTSEVTFLTKDDVKVVSDYEVRLKETDKFIAIGAEFGYAIVPIVSGSEVPGQITEIVHFGDPRIFGTDYKKFETPFNGTLSVSTGNITRMNKMPTSNFRFVPETQTLSDGTNDIVVSIRQAFDAMLQFEPFVEFNGPSENEIIARFDKTIDDLNAVSGHQVYLCLKLHGFLVEGAGTK